MSAVRAQHINPFNDFGVPKIIERQLPKYPEAEPGDTVGEIMHLLSSGTNVFLTGAGGTGKTFTTKKILGMVKSPLKTATTALAARNFGGETIHKCLWFGGAQTLEGLRELDAKRVARWAECHGFTRVDQAFPLFFSRLEALLKAADLLIIDEISMASSQMIDMIFYRISQWRTTPLPILVVGDMMQLPHVNPKKDPSQKPPFQSENWNFKMVNLERIYRSDDVGYCQVQRQVRFGVKTKEVLEFIKQHRVSTLPEGDNDIVILAPKNSQVDSFNKMALRKLPGELLELEAEVVITDKNLKKRYIAGEPGPVAEVKAAIASIAPDSPLRLKEGARLLITDNVYDEMGDLQYYNGQRCTFLRYDVDNGVLVAQADDVDGGGVLRIARRAYPIHTNVVKGDAVTTETNLEVMHFPLRLAYAMTIHKSQGQTLDKVHIQCHSIFSAGQFYVAFSRATSAKGLTLSHFDPTKHIDADPLYVQFYKDAGVPVSM